MIDTTLTVIVLLVALVFSLTGAVYAIHARGVYASEIVNQQLAKEETIEGGVFPEVTSVIGYIYNAGGTPAIIKSVDFELTVENTTTHEEFLFPWHVKLPRDLNPLKPNEKYLVWVNLADHFYNVSSLRITRVLMIVATDKNVYTFTPRHGSAYKSVYITSGDVGKTIILPGSSGTVYETAGCIVSIPGSNGEYVAEASVWNRYTDAEDTSSGEHLVYKYVSPGVIDTTGTPKINVTLKDLSNLEDSFYGYKDLLECNVSVSYKLRVVDVIFVRTIEIYGVRSLSDELLVYAFSMYGKPIVVVGNSTMYPVFHYGDEAIKIPVLSIGQPAEAYLTAGDFVPVKNARVFSVGNYDYEAIILARYVHVKILPGSYQFKVGIPAPFPVILVFGPPSPVPLNSQG